jgi:RND family efflux transporter MFP subunit
MNLNKKKLVPIVIFGGLLLLAIVIRSNPPETEQRGAFTGPMMVVDTTPVALRDYAVHLQSYGTVQPRTQSTLVAQVGGQIVSVNENVRDGGFFEKGDILASIDARDYEANVRIAEAVLMDARQTYAEAEARSNQARQDWERLGNEGEAPDLVLKLPQLAAAQARIISAESTLQKALLELERTQIVAPFAGRILRKHADIGQFVSNNSPLADIYATDYVEIRLPIRNRDLGFIDLPETYRDDTSAEPVSGVKIRSDLVGSAAWDAKLVRTEGAIDETARQLHVIAQIDDPFAEHEGQRPPKIGQYVTAELLGKTLSNVLVIPNNAIYQGSYVYVVENDLLQRRDVVIAWQNDKDAIIASGLSDGDDLVTTALGQVTSGIRVSKSGVPRGDRRQAGPPGSKPQGARAQPQGSGGANQ